MQELSLCEVENGTKIAELLQARASGHQGTWQMLKRIQILQDGRVPSKEAKDWKIERKEEEDHKEGIQKAVK